MGIDREMLQAIGQLMDVKLDPIKADIAGLKQSQGELRQTVDALAQLQDGLRRNVDGLKHKQEEQVEFERGTRILLEGMDRNIRLLAEGHQINAEKLRRLDRIEMTLNDVKSEVEVIKHVVSWHSEAILDTK